MTGSGTPRQGQGGFSLLEILAAMMILCMGLLALSSCWGTCIRSNTYAAERADAVRVAQEQMEAVQGRDFDRIVSQTAQVQRNGIMYTYDIVVDQRKELKDVNITVTWASRRPGGGAGEQVQLATVILHR